jgi:hypothetical protein
MHSTVLIFILFAHFMADFFWPGTAIPDRAMAGIQQNFVRSLAYALLISIVSMLSFGIQLGIIFACLLGTLHFITNLISKAILDKFPCQEEKRRLFVWLGFDQLLHQIGIVFSYSQ